MGVPNSVAIPLDASMPMAMVMFVLLSEVTVLLNWSATWTVTAGLITVPKATFEGCWPNNNLYADAGVTLTDNGVGVLTEPCVALMLALSALYKTIEPPLVETPLVKVMVVLEPKLIAEPVLSVTVGVKLPIELAPENTSTLSPANEADVPPEPSTAVMVN